MKRTLLLAVALILLVASSASGLGIPATKTINMRKHGEFDPAKASTALLASVRWHNSDSVTRSATSVEGQPESFAVELSPNDVSSNVTPQYAGTYKYTGAPVTPKSKGKVSISPRINADSITLGQEIQITFASTNVAAPDWSDIEVKTPKSDHYQTIATFLTGTDYNYEPSRKGHYKVRARFNTPDFTLGWSSPVAFEVT